MEELIAKKTANAAQKFLLDNHCGDLILNDTRAKNVEYRIYASDIMMKFLESVSGQSNEKSVCPLCGGKLHEVCYQCTKELCTPFKPKPDKELLILFAGWVTCIGEQFFDTKITIQEIVDEFIKQKL